MLLFRSSEEFSMSQMLNYTKSLEVWMNLDCRNVRVDIKGFINIDI